MALPDALSDLRIVQDVGPESFARGLKYARSGRVLSVSFDEVDQTVWGQVRGSEPKPYDVLVRPDRSRPTGFLGDCSCFVGGHCKHVAAVLVALRWQLVEPTLTPLTPPVRRPAWERQLDPLLQPTVPAGRYERLGLRFEANPQNLIELKCRPVRPGKSGAWVQQHASFAELQYDRSGRFDPVQRELLSELGRLSNLDRYAYYGRGDWADLGVVPRGVWTLLSDLADAGVAFVGTRGTDRVELSDAVADVAMDVVANRTADGRGGLQVRPRLTLGEDDVPYRRLGFLGDPAHGLVLETAGSGPGLLLVPLARRLDDASQRWLALSQTVEVSEEDRQRFLSEVAPRLRRRLPLRSSDRSVDFPPPPLPTLALEVQHGAPGEVRLAWSVCYRGGERTNRFDPAQPEDRVDDASQLRDLDAELAGWAALPIATRVWPGGQASTAAPVPPPSWPLSGVDAARFVADIVPQLVDAGVEVTPSGEQRDYRRSDSVPQIAVSVSDVDDRSDWYDLTVSVELDGEQVPFDLLFRALAGRAEELILPSGVFFHLDRPELKQLADLIVEARSLQDRERDGVRIHASQQSLFDDLVSCGVVHRQSERWLRAARALSLLEQPEQVDPPAGLQAELRPYQLQGYAWLWQLWSVGLGGILADDMGLGKTLQTLALICAVVERSPEPGRPFLVVAPTSVVANWATEAERFTPGLRVTAIDASERRRGTPLAEIVGGSDVVVTSYTLLRIDAEHYGAHSWRGVFLDEAQFVKNHHSKTYACLRRMQADVTVALTGTPLENSLLDLWSMLSLTAPGMFPSPQKFTEYYRTPIERGEAPERLALLRRRIRPFLLRRTKETVASELPAKQEQVLEVDLHSRHLRIYQTYLQRERQKVLGLIEDLDDNRFTILRSLTLLRQLSLDAALVDEQHEGVPSSKIDVLAQMLPELVAEGHRALVFSQFTTFLRRIGDRLSAEGVDYSYLDGQTRRRSRVIEQFKSGDRGVFLISLKAGGFGLNLTEADYCFVCDPWWNPAVEAQAVDRTHRIGQTRPVMVYRLVSRDTIEDKVMALKARKQQLFSSVLEADGLPGGALTSDDIRELLAS